MKLYADLHLHSRFSRATSREMKIEVIARFAEVKGLNLVGTGDALHPEWLSELKQKLNEDPETGFYKVSERESVWFVVQTEVATVHRYREKSRRIHHVILLPTLETAEQVADRLSRFGPLESDGRPILETSPAELVEEARRVDRSILVFPAHAWTPWWSIFGAFSGVDTVEEAYEDQSPYVYALETGLSSDPPMNWRVSSLDRFTLVSASDSHSPWPYRLGREACLFEWRKPSYRELVETLRTGDPGKIKLTLEVNPAYGNEPPRLPDIPLVGS